MKNKRLLVSIMAGILAFIMILSLIIGLLPQANAASSSEIKQQINSMESKQDEMEKILKDLEAQRKENLTEINDMMSQKTIIEQQINVLYEQIDNLNEQIAAYALLIADKQAELDEAEVRLAQLNEKNKERIRAMEEDGELSYWSVLFMANSFSDLLDRLNMIQEIAASDKRRLDEMSAVAAEIADAKQTLTEEKKQLEHTKEEATAKQAELEVRSKEVQDLLAQLNAKGDEFDALMDKQEQELEKLEQQINASKQEYDKVKYQEWLATSVPPTTVKPSYSGGGTGGSSAVNGNITWLVPCNYNRVSSVFGYRWHPVYGDWRFHAGVDLAVGCTPIYATRAGVVEISTYSSSAGNYVVIDHMDGYKSTYMHMCKSPYVKKGQYVEAGQVIGCVGSTGASTGSHLHFGISYNGVAMNPMDFIG